MSNGEKPHWNIPIYTQRDMDINSAIDKLNSAIENLDKNSVTKTDLANAKTKIVMWVAGLLIAGIGTITAILRYLTPSGPG